MRKYVRYAVQAIAVLVALAGAGAAYAAWRYHQEMAINAPNGIDEAGYVRIGGIDQWVQVRGQDKSNPVLLWLNGGPGFSVIRATYFFRDWEKHFTVVMWDQRGEGRTFDKSGTSVAPTMTIDGMAEDGIELSNYLRVRLHKDKIILLGHSWGSILGVHMVRQRPDLFYAYVGTGQVNQLRSDVTLAYPRLLARAQATHNQQAVKELKAAGPPPYANAAKYFVPIQWANTLDPPLSFPITAGAVGSVLVNAFHPVLPGLEFSQGLSRLMRAMIDENLSASRLDVPVVIIAGSEDLVTPNAKSFFDTLAAPHKEFLAINGGGHLAILGRRADFLGLLVTHVLPLAGTK
jgi:pimeloyl-ACP methyl ester carboxylesterase